MVSMESLIKFLRNQFRDGFFNSKLLNTKDVTDPIVRAIEEKEILTSILISNPEDISSGVIDAQKATTQAIKDIVIPEPKEVDFTRFYEKFDELKTAIDKKELSVAVGETKVEVDTKGIISSVERLQQAVEGSKETIEPQEVIDYTELLAEVIKNLEKPGYDYSKIEKLLDVISKKEVVLPLDEKGRVKVSVDRISNGGRGSLSSTESAKLLTLATEEKQDEIIAALGGGVRIKKIDEAPPYTYIGEANVGTATSAASWRIKRVDDTSDPDSTILYAGTGAFDQVWDNRASLSYN